MSVWACHGRCPAQPLRAQRPSSAVVESADLFPGRSHDQYRLGETLLRELWSGCLDRKRSGCLFTCPGQSDGSGPELGRTRVGHVNQPFEKATTW